MQGYDEVEMGPLRFGSLGCMEKGMGKRQLPKINILYDEKTIIKNFSLKRILENYIVKSLNNNHWNSKLIDNTLSTINLNN